MNRLLHRHLTTAVCRMAIAVSLVLAIGQPLSAQDGEFPAEWYFSSMENMREDLEGRPAPEISTDTWIGDETSLQACRGKVVVLDFWATWCGPCVASIPKNIAMVDAHPDDLVFIGMHSATSGWDKAEKMVEDREINYPVVLDTGETADAYQITGFPTYVIIDAEGIVRAAGVMPSHVKEIVQKLIEESGSSPSTTQFASLKREWFHSGASWMRPWQEQLGEPARPIQSSAWWMPGDDISQPEQLAAQAEVSDEAEDEIQTASPTPEGYSENDLEGLVRVMHFTRPGMSITDKQLELLNETAKQYSPQGVVFTTVCDHQSDWEQSRSLAAKIDLQMPMVLDLEATSAPPDEDNGEGAEGSAEAIDAEPIDAEPIDAEPIDAEPIDAEPIDAEANAGDASTSKPVAREAGQTARSYHIRIAPVTVLIDRKGRIRATGLRVDQLGNALDVMLAEQGG